MSMSERAKTVKFCPYGHHHVHEKVQPNLLWSFELDRVELVFCCDTCYRQGIEKYQSSVLARP